MKQTQKKLAFMSAALPVFAVVMGAVLASSARAQASEAGCYYEGLYTSHNGCASNNCWFWEDGVRCNNGNWQGGCGCDPIPPAPAN